MGKYGYRCGGARSCRVYALGALNSCKETGWAGGILGSCNKSEPALIARQHAKTADYVGTHVLLAEVA